MGDGKIMAASRDELAGERLARQRWQRVKSLLAAALDIDPAERSVYLETACAGDSELRSEIEDLLLRQDQPDPQLASTPASMYENLAETFDEEVRIGSRVGPYQLVEEIGVGGMGEVYRAFRADDQYRKEVAIKLIRAGQGSKFVVSRFKSERQVLASLDHPNIALLLDGGTMENGMPYFVMELVEGQPITKYCDDNKLPTTERLRLFLQVCPAVQYAHQRLIIHRDLKPSNILVTQEGIPKLLDFGIAKILDPTAVSEALEPTMSVFRLLTPGYASPEQIKGEAITTASDVYSLGVLLYELLTGHRPYPIASHAPHEIAQAVCEIEPERPSAVVWRTGSHETVHGSIEITPSSVSSVRDGSAEKLSRCLRGDLDNIVLMALRKEPQRRYASVEQFAEDIRRHLDSLPVAATKDTIRYRASKFVSRHKAGVAVALALALTVLAGLTATLYEAHIARIQQLRAEQRFNDVRALANSLMFDVHDSIQDLPGSTPARRLLVERALKYLDSLSRDASSDQSLQRELATAYEKLGTVQGNPFGANLGDTQGALNSYSKSLAIRTALSVTHPENLTDRLAVARTQRLIAAILSNRGDHDSLRKLREAASAAEQILTVAPSDPDILKEVQADYYLLGVVLDGRGDYGATAEALQKNLLVTEKQVQTSPDVRDMRRQLGRVEAKLGYALARAGNRKEGLDHAMHGLEILQSLAADTHDAESLRWLGMAHWMLGDILLLDGDSQGALRNYEQQRSINSGLAASDPANAVVQYDLGCATARVGNAEALAGDVTGIDIMRRAATMFEAQLARDPAYIEPRFCLAATFVWMGEAFSRRGANELALESYRKGLDLWEPLALNLKGTCVEADLALIHEKIGRALLKLGKPLAATDEQLRGVEIAKSITETNAKVSEAQYALADGYSGLGESSQALGSDIHVPVQDRIQYWNKARTWYQHSRETWQGIPNPGVRTPVGFACGSPKKAAQELADSEVALPKLDPSSISRPQRR